MHLLDSNIYTLPNSMLQGSACNSVWKVIIWSFFCLTLSQIFPHCFLFNVFKPFSTFQSRKSLDLTNLMPKNAIKFQVDHATSKCLRACFGIPEPIFSFISRSFFNASLLISVHKDRGSFVKGNKQFVSSTLSLYNPLSRKNNRR